MPRRTARRQRQGRLAFARGTGEPADVPPSAQSGRPRKERGCLDNAIRDGEVAGGDAADHLGGVLPGGDPVEGYALAAGSQERAEGALRWVTGETRDPHAGIEDGRRRLDLAERQELAGAGDAHFVAVPVPVPIQAGQAELKRFADHLDVVARIVVARHDGREDLRTRLRAVHDVLEKLELGRFLPDGETASQSVTSRTASERCGF